MVGKLLAIEYTAVSSKDFKWYDSKELYKIILWIPSKRESSHPPSLEQWGQKENIH